MQVASQVPSVVPPNVGIGKINTAAARLSSDATEEVVVSEEIFNLHMAVYPNPSKGMATVSFELPADGIVGLHVTDMLGRTVLQAAPAAFSAGRHEIGVDLSGAQQGVYIFHLKHAGKVLRDKLVVEK